MQGVGRMTSIDSWVDRACRWLQGRPDVEQGVDDAKDNPVQGSTLTYTSTFKSSAKPDAFNATTKVRTTGNSGPCC